MNSIGIPLVVSLVVVIGFIGIYYLVTGIMPGARTIETTPPVENGMDESQAKFMFFYTPWCPWCKKAQQPWASFKEMLKNSHYMYGGKKVVLEDINCDSDKGKSALYKITAYPTFKVETNMKVFEMSGKPTVENFRNFLKQVLGAEKAL